MIISGPIVSSEQFRTPDTAAVAPRWQTRCRGAVVLWRWISSIDASAASMVYHPASTPAPDPLSAEWATGPTLNGESGRLEMERGEGMAEHEMAGRDYSHAVAMARRAGHDKALASTPEEFRRALRREDRWNARARDAAARFASTEPSLQQ